jgi:hypothetical protein
MGHTPLHFAVRRTGAGSLAALLAAGANPFSELRGGMTPLQFLNSLHSRHLHLRPAVYRITTLLVAAGDRRWECVPKPCPGLEAALVLVWDKAPKETVAEDLSQLFQRLKPVVQAALREALRALHHGGLDEPLRMEVLKKVFEFYRN